MKKFVKLCLHSSYIVLNTFHFHEIFHFKIENLNVIFGKKVRETLVTFKLSFYRYIFYDVNPGEGFNLRRDVFMRIAVMVKQLNQQSTKHVYTLVSFSSSSFSTFARNAFFSKGTSTLGSTLSLANTKLRRPK